MKIHWAVLKRGPGDGPQIGTAESPFQLRVRHEIRAGEADLAHGAPFQNRAEASTNTLTSQATGGLARRSWVRYTFAGRSSLHHGLHVTQACGPKPCTHETQAELDRPR